MADDHTNEGGPDPMFFVDNALRISCADAIELVTEFLDGQLSAADQGRFDAHLALCEGCRVFLDQVRTTVTITSATRDTTIPLRPANFDALLRELHARVDPEAGPPAGERPAGERPAEEPPASGTVSQP